MTLSDIAEFWGEFTTALVGEAKESFQIFLDALWDPWIKIEWYDPFSWLNAVASSLFGIWSAMVGLMENLALNIPFAFFEALRKRAMAGIPKAWNTQVMTRKQAFALTLDLLCDKGPRDVAEVSGEPLAFALVQKVKAVFSRLKFLRKLDDGGVFTRYLQSKLNALRTFVVFRIVSLIYTGFRFWGLVVLLYVTLKWLQRVEKAQAYGEVFQQNTARKRVRVRTKSDNAGRISIRRRMIGGNKP